MISYKGQSSKNEDFTLTRNVFGDRLNKNSLFSVEEKIAYPYEAFKNLSEYENPITNLKKQGFFQIQIQKARRIIGELNPNTGTEVRKIYNLIYVHL